MERVEEVRGLARTIGEVSPVGQTWELSESGLLWKRMVMTKAHTAAVSTGGWQGISGWCSGWLFC